MQPENSLEESCFEGCSSLTSIYIPETMTSFGKRCFRYCSGLTSITIPSSVTSLGIECFSGCSGLESITVEEGNSVYDSRNNCDAIIVTSENQMFVGCKNTIIPNSITSLGDYSFEDCTGLTSIDIPNSVTSLGDYSFRYCSSLATVICEIPTALKGDFSLYITIVYIQAET